MQIQLYPKIAERILVAEVPTEHCEGSVGHADIAQSWLGRDACLGMRAREEEASPNTGTLESYVGVALRENWLLASSAQETDLLKRRIAVRKAA
jgi:hypothetical protein